MNRKRCKRTGCDFEISHQKFAPLVEIRIEHLANTILTKVNAISCCLNCQRERLGGINGAMALSNVEN
jgi:hypothetical protein